MPPLPLRARSAVALAAAALVVPGCGSGRSAAVADDRPVSVSLSEFRVDPQQLRLSPGRRTFVVRNDGRMVHRFELRRADGAGRRTRGAPLRPGASERLTVTLRPGDYLIRCAQERHNTLGEWGRVTVAEGG